MNMNKELAPMLLDEIRQYVDAVPAVRCRDCKYGEQDDFGEWFCVSFYCTVGNEDGSGFCADGERREDAD